MGVSRYNVMTYVKEATSVNAGQRGCGEKIHPYFQRYGATGVSAPLKAIVVKCRQSAGVIKVCFGVLRHSSSRLSFIVGKDYYSEIHSGALKKISQVGVKK